MSSWQDVDLRDLPTGRELLPAASYTVEVLGGAKAGTFDSGAIDVPVAVVGGEFNGKRLFMSFPNPEKQDWSPTAVKRVGVALGVDFEQGEHPIAYFQRVQGLRFTLPVSIVKDKEGIDRQRLGILNPSPAKQ